MAKKTSKKRVVTTVKKAPVNVKSGTPLAPAPSRRSSGKKSEEPLLFGKINYILMLVGVVLMTVGFLLMLGGDMPDPNTWDEDIIYNFRRIKLSPLLILAGLVTMIFAIFKKAPTVNTNA